MAWRDARRRRQMTECVLCHAQSVNKMQIIPQTHSVWVCVCVCVWLSHETTRKWRKLWSLTKIDCHEIRQFTFYFEAVCRDCVVAMFYSVPTFFCHIAWRAHIAAKDFRTQSQYASLAISTITTIWGMAVERKKKLMHWMRAKWFVKREAESIEPQKKWVKLCGITIMAANYSLFHSFMPSCDCGRRQSCSSPSFYM